MIRIVAMDDHLAILTGLETMISKEKDMQLVATARHGSEVPAMVREHEPDLLILDLGVSKRVAPFDPIGCVENLKAQRPQLKVLVLSTHDDDFWVRTMVQAGVDGYMLKDDFLVNIVYAIRIVNAGGPFFSAEIAEVAFRPRGKSQGNQEVAKLETDEISILVLLAKGLTVGAIAACLKISEKHTRNKVTVIYKKLDIKKEEGISMRTVALKKARELGLLPEDDLDGLKKP